MTTKSTLEQIKQRQKNLEFTLAAQHLLALPFLSIGWVLGFLWWVIIFWISSFAQGWLYWNRQ